MGLLKKLAGETAIYGLSSVLGRLLNYLLVPLYTAVFSPGEFGVVTELYAYVAFLNVIYLYGMETAFFRFASREATSAYNYYSNAFWLVLITSLVFSGTLAAFATPIADWLQYPGKEQYIYWFSAIMAVDAVMAIPFAQLRLQSKAVKFASIKLFNIGLTISLNLFLLLYLPKQAAPLFGLAYSSEIGVGYVFIANVVANLLLVPLLWREIISVKWRLSKKIIREMLHYGWPLMIMGLAGVTNEMLSRAMLKHLLPGSFYPDKSNLEALGIFGASYKLSVFMTLGIQAFRYAAEPFFFNQAQDKNSPALFSAVTDKFIIFSTWVFVAISMHLNILGTLFLRNPAYHEGLSVVPQLLLGGLFLGIYYNLSIWYKLTDKTLYGAAIAIFGGCITVIFNIILIPKLGYEGSAWVTLLTYSSMTVVSYFFGQKHYPIPYRVNKAILHIGVGTLMVVGYQYLHFESYVSQIGFNGLWLTLYAGAVIFWEKRQ